MRARVAHLLFASVLLSGLAAACGKGDTDTTDTPGSGTGSLVLGVRSKLTPGVAIDGMRVVIKDGSETVLDEQLPTNGTALKFPAEFRVDDLPEGTQLDATITGTDDGFPVLERLASTEILADKTLLLQVELESACLQIPGGGAPQCDAPGTCIKGVCGNSKVDPDNLPEYDPNWANGTVDVCKPEGAGDPIVVVGEGQADYLPISDGAVAQVEAGPQGGHHIWIAVRTKNLTQSGSITSLTGKFPDLGHDVGPFNVIFSFDPDEGSYCKLYGLRFQLDAQHPIEELLGQTFEITATITDKDKDIGTGTKTVKLSDDILGG